MLFIEHGHSNTQFFKRKVVFSLIVLDIFVNMKANLDEFQAPFVCKKVHENAHSFEIDSLGVKILLLVQTQISILCYILLTKDSLKVSCCL